MKHKFKYYLHDDYSDAEAAEHILLQCPDLDMTEEEFAEGWQRPFYEVTFDCEYDDETGEVHLIGIKL